MEEPGESVSWVCIIITLWNGIRLGRRATAYWVGWLAVHQFRRHSRQNYPTLAPGSVDPECRWQTATLRLRYLRCDGWLVRYCESLLLVPSVK